jgi:SHS2 domain-containing protein
MPRRKKAQLYDLINRIVYLYETEKKSFKEIESILRAEGYDISKSAIHRAYKSYAETAEEFKRIYEETKALIDTLKENPATDVMEGIATILANRLFKFVKDIEAMDFETPEELILAVQRLSKTLSDLQKIREEREKKALEVLEKGAEEGKVDAEIIQKIREIYGA